MIHELSEPSPEFGQTLIYDVLRIQDDELEVALRGETRRSEDGELVRWALLYSSEARLYCWRRSDWQQDRCTAASKLCALEALNSWSQETETRVTEECKISLKDSRLFKAMVAGQRSPIGDEDRALVCQCNTYELRMRAAEPESLDLESKNNVLLRCMVRHVIKERPLGVRETCVAMAKTEGFSAQTTENYCTCLTDLFDRAMDSNLSTKEIEDLRQKCADDHLSNSD